MATPDVTQKAEIYETLSALNLAFGAIAEHLQTMRQIGVLRVPDTRLCLKDSRGSLQVRSQRGTLLEKMNQIELVDWARYGKVRIKWEKYLRGPEPKRRKK